MNTRVTFDFEPYNGMNPLTIEGLREHVIDKETSNEFLLVNEMPTAIPEIIPVPLSEILLGKLGSAEKNGEIVNVFRLPDDYLPLSAVLNDASSSMSSRASSVAYGVFREIGHSLLRIHQLSGLIPVDLSYEDIIIERDVDKFKILPPVELVHAADRDIVRDLGGVLLDELVDNAGNTQRRLLVGQAFQGFWDSIDRGQ